MSNISIYEKKWLDVVFEGKNQLYGAYQLRLQNPRTTLNALLLGILLFGSILILAFLTRSADQSTGITLVPDDGQIVLARINPPQSPQPKMAIPPPVQKKNENQASAATYEPAKIDHTSAEPETQITPNTATGSGSGTIDGPNIGISSASPHIGASGDEGNVPLLNTAMLDKMPEFPGGIDVFLKYVGNNFKKPEFDEATTLRVIMSFVIEKDGSMTDIKVLKNPGHGLDKEAIRVLKSQKTKWRPGIRNGEPVRTLYTLPISISVN